MILLTGATGLLGHYLVEALRREGFPLRLLVRNPEKAKPLQSSNVDLIEGDILDQASLEEALKGIDTVIHAAGLVSFHQKDRERVMQVNADGTALLVDACLMAGVNRLVHISSVAAIGDTTDGTEATEHTPWQATRRTSHYARSKRRAEMEVYRGIAEGMEAAILNPGVVLGYGGDWEKSSAKLYATAARGLRFYLNGRAGVVNATDVAKAVTLLLKSEQFPSGERFILCAENLSTLDLLGQIASSADTPAPSIPVPGWLAFGAAWILENVLGGKSALTMAAVRGGLSRQTYDGSKIRQIGLEYEDPQAMIDELAQEWAEEV